jgi:hypothetical protein
MLVWQKRFNLALGAMCFVLNRLFILKIALFAYRTMCETVSSTQSNDISFGVHPSHFIDEVIIIEAYWKTKVESKPIFNFIDYKL